MEWNWPVFTRVRIGIGRKSDYASLHSDLAFSTVTVFDEEAVDCAQHSDARYCDPYQIAAEDILVYTKGK